MEYNQVPPCMMWGQMQGMNMCNPMMNEVEDKDLEILYPKIYFKLMPLVKYHCDEIERVKGVMYSPTKEELESISKMISSNIENDIDDDEKHHHGDGKDCKSRCSGYQEYARTRQFGGGFLRDLATILLLRELGGRRRRRRPYYGGYGYYY